MGRTKSAANPLNMFRLTGDTAASFPHDLAPKDFIESTGQDFLPFYNPIGRGYQWGRASAQTRRDVSVWGGDMALQIMEIVARISPTHSACINAELTYTYGTGLQLVEANRNRQRIFDIWWSTPNSRGNLPGEEIKRYINDYYSFGNRYLMVSEHNGVPQLFYQSQWDTRLKKPEDGKTVTHACISRNFLARTGIKQRPVDMIEIPMYHSGNRYEMEDGTLVSILHSSDPSPAFPWYGYPKSGAAHLPAWNEYMVSKFLNDTLGKGFFPNVIMQMVSPAQTPEQVQEFKDRVMAEFQGDGNYGGIFLQTIASKEDAGTITAIPQTIPKELIDYKVKQEEDVIRAHRIPPVIAGMFTGGSLGVNQREIVDSYDLYYNTVIKHEAESIAASISEVMFPLIGARMEFGQLPPIRLNVKTINELRADQGLPPVANGDVIPPNA